MKWRVVVFGLIFFCCEFLSGQTGEEVDITKDSTHHMVLQNQYVRVFEVQVPPHGASILHKHDHDYVFVVIGNAAISNKVAGKAPVKLRLQEGETRFLNGGFSHVTKNLGDSPYRNINVEFLQDEKARQSPPPAWDEERGFHVLKGGTQHIMFVADGVRVSEVDLQPRGLVPLHRHAGPHLVIGITDLHLSSDVAGKGASTKTMKAGEVAWVPGGFSHTLKNLGTQDAKFVTLEFK